MVDRSETVWKHKNGIYFRAEFGEVEVSSGDTVTLEGFEATPTGITKAVLILQSTGLEHGSYSVNGTTKNQIDISGGDANSQCVYVAYGVKA